jgi:CDP-diacylglycerol--serine O-phosphatidyltransferase
MNYIANILTLGSLFCGFLSVILSLERHFTFAAWAIICSAILDGLDGQFAGRNPLPSEFGKELDSLVDVVAFGVAPSVLGYVFIYMQFYLLAVLALCTYLICSVWRLAKYNLTPKNRMVYNFIGLPTTVSGGILVSYILACIEKDRFSPLLFVLLVLLLAYLMVSRARYLNLDGIKQVLGFSLKPAILSLIIALGIAFYLKKPGLGLLSVFLIYLIFSPFVVKRLDNN